MARPYTWRQAVAESDLPATTKHVLLTLSLFLSDIGEGVFPSLRTLMRYTSLSRPAIRKHLKDAAEAGWIQKEERRTSSGRQTSNLYICTTPPTGGVRPFDGEAHLTWGGKPEGEGKPRDPLGGKPEGTPITLNRPEEQTTILSDADASDAREKDFETLWHLDRRGLKWKAWAQYKRRVPRDVSGAAVLTAWKALRATVSEPKYLPHLWRWLRDQGWTEHVPSTNGQDAALVPGTPEWLKREEARIRG